MEQRQERRTYASKDAVYNLDPARVFNFVADLSTHLNLMKHHHNVGTLVAIALKGDGRRLLVNTEAIDKPGIYVDFDLAELVLAEDNSKLTFITHEHPRVGIPSEYLHQIARKYQIG